MQTFRGLALTTALLIASGAARAEEVEPAAWLRQVYAAYERAQNNDKLDSQVSYKLVARRASRSLAALFKRNADCEKKSSEICAIDWDFVIDGQDWELSKVNVGAAHIVGDKATVTVSFQNLKTPCVNVYYFVREGGDWKVDDIETRPKGEKPIRIAKMLRDFKDY